MLADERTPGIRIIQHHVLAHILFEVSNPAEYRRKKKRKFMKTTERKMYVEFHFRGNN